MTNTITGKHDFFISFNQADRDWATWIAWVLEEAGYSIFFQDWDFRGNFVLEMDRAYQQSHYTIAVLSPDYLASRFTAPEWAARFAEDARNTFDLLIPIRVRPCNLEGLLGLIVYVDLVGLTRDQARRRLLDRVAGIRLKPDEEPFYPGGPPPAAARSIPSEPRFPIVTHNLPPANPGFVGREQVLAKLRRLLIGGRGPVALTGLGGVGKTQTALAYAWHHLTDYRLIWWLRADSPAALAADYAALAEPLGLDLAAADQPKLIAAVRDTLQAVDSGLFIFDNVEDPELPRTYLPTTGDGHVLITSRRTDWQGIAKALALEVMTEDEALQLLTGRPDPDTLPATERAEAKVLAKELGHLPLALAQARAYMAKAGKSFAGYRRLLQASRRAVLGRGRPSPNYPTSVAKAWQISIEAAESGCAAARPLLELLAFFAPDTLPVEVLASAPATLPEGLREELARDEAISALKRFSLIRAQKDAITVHRLIQAVTRDGLDPAIARARAEAVVRLVSAALPDPVDHTYWPKFGALLPHALAAADAAVQLGVGLETSARVLNETANYHQSRGAWAEAEPLYQRALAIYEKILGPEHPDLASLLNNLAMLYHAQGRYAEAEPLLKRAIAIDEKMLGPERPNFATRLDTLAGLYQATGRYAEAEPLLKRAIAIDEKVLGPERPDFATRLDTLAGLYQATGRLAEAEPLLKRALAIYEKVLGPEHPDVATTLNNLTGLYWATGRFAEAEPLYQRALKIREKVLGPEHPHVAQSLNNLAALYHAQGRFAEAEPLYQRALVIYEKVLGPEHPDVATRLNDLAALYHAQGRFAEAEPLLKRALAIREKVLGLEHPHVATSLNNLAALYHAQGRFAEAEPLFQRALAIVEKVLGPEHPDVATSLNNLAALYDNQGRFAEAEPLLKRALAIREKVLGLEHPDVAQSLNDLANLYRDTGRSAEAEPLYQRALVILEKALRPDHPHRMRVQENYAHLLDRLGRHDEAAELRAPAQAIR